MDIYISPSGSDTNTGTQASPYKTLSKARSRATPGDNVLLLAGTYTNPGYQTSVTDYWQSGSALDWNNRSGTDLQPITIKPAPGAEGLVIVRSQGDFGFQISNSSYINIEGIKCIGENESIPLQLARDYQYAYKTGTNDADARTKAISYRIARPTTEQDLHDIESIPKITSFVLRPAYFSTLGFLVQQCHHINVTNCTITQFPGSGLRAFSSGAVTFKKCNVTHNSKRSASGNHGVIIHTASDNGVTGTHEILIEDCFVCYNYNEVSSWSSLKDFVHFGYWDGTKVVEQFDEGYGLSHQKTIWTNGRCVFRNNVVAFNGKGAGTNEGHFATFESNTIYHNNGSDLNISNQGVGLQNGAPGTILRNNLIVLRPGSTGFPLNTDGAQNTSVLVNEGNYCIGGNQTRLNSPGNVYQPETFDPMFVNPANLDFHLQTNSPVIGFSAPSSFVDFDGVARTLNTPGAYEYTPTPLPPPTVPDTITTTPPTTTQPNIGMSATTAQALLL